MTYKEKLKDPRWQKKQLEILNRISVKNAGMHDLYKTLSKSNETNYKGQIYLGDGMQLNPDGSMEDENAEKDKRRPIKNISIRDSLNKLRYGS